MNNPSAKQIRIWVEKISESDKEAFNSLFRSLYPQLLKYALRFIRSKVVASDITQDAFVTLWDKRDELDGQRSVKAYLYRIVRNSSLNYIRDHSSETIGLDDVEESRIEVAEEEQPEETDELINLLKEWIKELPDRRREAFVLSRFEGLDHEEIADVMDISSNTVNNHIVAVLDYLKDCSSKYQEEMNNKRQGYD